MCVDGYGCQIRLLQPTSSVLCPTSGLLLANYHSYSVMAYSRVDSIQVGGTKRTVDNNGDRAMSMFVVSTVRRRSLRSLI